MNERIRRSIVKTGKAGLQMALSAFLKTVSKFIPFGRGSELVANLDQIPFRELYEYRGTEVAEDLWDAFWQTTNPQHSALTYVSRGAIDAGLVAAYNALQKLPEEERSASWNKFVNFVKDHTVNPVKDTTRNLSNKILPTPKNLTPNQIWFRESSSYAKEHPFIVPYEELDTAGNPVGMSTYTYPGSKQMEAMAKHLYDPLTTPEEKATIEESLFGITQSPAPKQKLPTPERRKQMAGKKRLTSSEKHTPLYPQHPLKTQLKQAAKAVGRNTLEHLAVSIIANDMAGIIGAMIHAPKGFGGEAGLEETKRVVGNLPHKIVKTGIDSAISLGLTSLGAPPLITYPLVSFVTGYVDKKFIQPRLKGPIGKFFKETPYTESLEMQHARMYDTLMKEVENALKVINKSTNPEIRELVQKDLQDSLSELPITAERGKVNLDQLKTKLISINEKLQKITTDESKPDSYRQIMSVFSELITKSILTLEHFQDPMLTPEDKQEILRGYSNYLSETINRIIFNWPALKTMGVIGIGLALVYYISSIYNKSDGILSMLGNFATDAFGLLVKGLKKGIDGIISYIQDDDFELGRDGVIPEGGSYIKRKKEKERKKKKKIFSF